MMYGAVDDMISALKASIGSSNLFSISFSNEQAFCVIQNSLAVFARQRHFRKRVYMKPATATVMGKGCPFVGFYKRRQTISLIAAKRSQKILSSFFQKTLRG